MNKPKRSRKISTSNNSNLVESESIKTIKEPTQSESKIIIDKGKTQIYNYSDAIIDGLGLLELKTEKMNEKQLEEIYLGFLNGINYKKYANPNISHQLMGIIRHALENDIDVEVIVKTNRVMVKMVQ